MNKKGSILVHVLITTVIVATICAGLAQMLMLRWTTSARATQGSGGRVSDTAAFSNVLQAWNASNQVCSGVTGFSCSGGGCGANLCNCVMAPSPACTCSGTNSCQGTLTAALSGGRCKITVTSCQ
jgi:hypothetical protein